MWDAALALLAHVGSTAGTDESVAGKRVLELGSGVGADESVAGKRVLELGSGVGAVGIGAKLFGAQRVTLTDVAAVVSLLEANIELNNVQDVTAVALDWFEAVPAAVLDDSFDLILASDVVYDPDLHAPLLKTLEVMLERVPVCLLAHRKRNPHDAEFFGALRARLDVVQRTVASGGGFERVPEDVVLFAVRRKG